MKEKRPTKKRAVMLILIVLIIFAVIITAVRCAVSNKSVEDSTDSGILVEPLTKHDLSTSITASGTIESQNTVSVTSELTCKIAQLNVQVGDMVQAGDVLCVFDAADLNAQIASLEEQLSNSDLLLKKQNEINRRALDNAKEEQVSQLADAQKAIDTAQNDYNNAETYKNNVDQSYASMQTQIKDTQTSMNNILQNEGENDSYYALQASLADLTSKASDLLSSMDSAKSTLTECQTALDTARASYNTVQQSTNQQIQSAQDTIDTANLSTATDTAQKDLDDLKRKLDKITVTADQAGIITSLNVDLGSIPTTSELMTIQDPSALKLTVSIKEVDILKIKEGMKTLVTSNATGDTQIEGTISKVVNFIPPSTAAVANIQGDSGNSGYRAEILLNGNSSLLLGMSAKAKILLSEEDEKTAVAYDSIEKDENGEHTSVYVATPSDTKGLYDIKKVDVTIQADSDYYTAISSDDLKEGDLIVSDPTQVEDGAQVQVDETYLTEEQAGE